MRSIQSILIAAWCACPQASCLPLVQQLFAPEPEASRPAGRTALTSFKFNSVASQFKRQLAELMGRLHAMAPHYIRCLKPSPSSQPMMFQDAYALQQLKCGGVMEAIRISCAGEHAPAPQLLRY